MRDEVIAVQGVSVEAMGRAIMEKWDKDAPVEVRSTENLESLGTNRTWL